MFFLELSPGGTMTIHDIHLRLKCRFTRQDAYKRLQTFLSCIDLPLAESGSPDLLNAVTFVAMRTSLFTVQEKFTVIDLALANVSIPEQSKKMILLRSRLLTYMPCRLSADLRLTPNLRGPLTRQGAYVRFLDLLLQVKSLDYFKSDILNAVRSITFQYKIFTSEQICKVLDCALDHQTFYSVEKEQFQIWKDAIIRMEPRTTINTVNHSSMDATKLSGGPSTRIGQELLDPKCAELAFLRLIKMLCNIEPMSIPSVNIYEASVLVATGSEFFSEDQCLLLSNCALRSDLLNERRKRAICNRNEIRVAASVLKGMSESRALVTEPSHSRRKSSRDELERFTPALFHNLTNPTTCQEAYRQVLEVATKGIRRPEYGSDVLNALNVIASQHMLFTNEQVFILVKNAISNIMYTGKQKAIISELEKERIENPKGDEPLPADSKDEPTIINEMKHEGFLGGQVTTLESPKNAPSEHNTRTVPENREIANENVDVHERDSMLIEVHTTAKTEAPEAPVPENQEIQEIREIANENVDVHERDSMLVGVHKTTKKEAPITNEVDNDFVRIFQKVVAKVCCNCCGFKCRGASARHRLSESD